MIAVMIKELKCPRVECGHKWIPRTRDPMTCPRCKTYLDKKKDKPNNQTKGKPDVKTN